MISQPLGLPLFEEQDNLQHQCLQGNLEEFHTALWPQPASTKACSVPLEKANSRRNAVGPCFLQEVSYRWTVGASPGSQLQLAQLTSKINTEAGEISGGTFCSISYTFDTI